MRIKKWVDMVFSDRKNKYKTVTFDGALTLERLIQVVELAKTYHASYEEDPLISIGETEIIKTTIDEGDGSISFFWQSQPTK
jgi:hypothetical protein